MKFRIEHLFQKHRPAYLFARQLEPGSFVLGETSRLGGVAIRPSISMPRSIKPDGSPDMTVFAFTLATANDLPKLTVGQVVELEVQ
jgi:hypothetical protein